MSWTRAQLAGQRRLPTLRRQPPCDCRCGPHATWSVSWQLAEHDLALARAARWMRMADAKLKVAKRIYEAKMRRLEATADTGSVERLSRRLMTEFEWKGHRLIHSKSEKIALAKKAEAKDYKLRFLGARERATASPSAARQHMRLVVPLCRPILGLRPHHERL